MIKNIRQTNINKNDDFEKKNRFKKNINTLLNIKYIDQPLEKLPIYKKMISDIELPDKELTRFNAQNLKLKKEISFLEKQCEELKKEQNELKKEQKILRSDLKSLTESHNNLKQELNLMMKQAKENSKL